MTIAGPKCAHRLTNRAAARRGELASWLVPRLIVVGVVIFVAAHVVIWTSGLSGTRAHRVARAEASSR